MPSKNAPVVDDTDDTAAVDTEVAPVVEVAPVNKADTFAQFYGIAAAWANWQTRSDDEIKAMLDRK